MNANEPINEVEESSYSMLAHSEEKKRAYFETIVYCLILFSVVAAILQFAEQADPLPLTTLPGSALVRPA